MAAQLIAMKRDRERGDMSCNARATSSLPVPDSPRISTVADVGATFSTVRSMRCISGSSVRMPASGRTGATVCSRRFSS
jgi:hypothetical protein